MGPILGLQLLTHCSFHITILFKITLMTIWWSDREIQSPKTYTFAIKMQWMTRYFSRAENCVNGERHKSHKIQGIIISKANHSPESPHTQEYAHYETNTRLPGVWKMPGFEDALNFFLRAIVRNADYKASRLWRLKRQRKITNFKKVLIASLYISNLVNFFTPRIVWISWFKSEIPQTFTL